MPIETLLPNIKAANQIFLNQQSELFRSREINQLLNHEVIELRTSLEICQSDWRTSDELTRALKLRIQEKDAIISKQSKMIRIVATIAATTAGYVVYKEIKGTVR